MKVSFGSTYKVTTDNKQNNYETFGKFSDLCLDMEQEDGVTTELQDKFIDCPIYMGSPKYIATRTLIVPDNMDKGVETYCANKGINFQKITNPQLLNAQNIINRIEDAPEDMIKVDVDIEKMESFLDKQESNIGHCEVNYDKYFKNNISTMIKSGDKIPATCMTIHGLGDTTKDVLSYIKRFGKDNLNNNQISFCFIQKTNKPDHCVYFALKNMGIKNIPMYVDKDSYKLGQALEIFN